MKYLVKIVAAPSVPGGKALALCSEDGVPVGKQISSEVSSEAGEISVIVVKFYVDGEDIRFADNDG